MRGLKSLLKVQYDGIYTSVIQTVYIVRVETSSYFIITSDFCKLFLFYKLMYYI